MPNFKLVNPLILGNLETDFSGKNIDNVAGDVWNSLSKYFSGNVPRFGFSLKNDSNDKLHHFMVKEKVSNNKIVDYSIENLDVELTNDQQKKFVNHINKLSKNIQEGGKRKRYEDNEDDDSSTDTDDIYERLNYYKRINQPFYYWWYNPMIYTIYGSKYNSIYMPTFSVPFYPYIELDVSSAFFA